MFKITDKTISFTRGDEISILFSIEDYIFTEYDYIKLKIYNERRLNQEPLLVKRIDVKEETEEIEIVLTSEETKKLSEEKNRTITLWYEIELNDKITVIGFDDEGAKVIKLMPEGKEVIDNE